jgi:DNA-binding response OmpR family regulator
MTSTNVLLHVEDDPNDVLLLQRAFRKANVAINIQAASDGDRAVAYLSGAGEFADREKFPLPNLVMLDLKMPRKSGLEVLAWIRNEAKLRRLIVLIFTSSKHDDDVNKAYDLGANSYLVKPVGFDMLVDLVKIVHQYWLTTNERAHSV